MWRRGVERLLREFVDRDDWSEPDAIRVVDLIARENAARIYDLG